jgi:hypothetical protein
LKRANGLYREAPPLTVSIGTRLFLMGVLSMAAAAMLAVGVVRWSLSEGTSPMPGREAQRVDALVSDLSARFAAHGDLHMVGHQHVGVEGAIVAQRGFTELLPVMQIVGIVGKAGVSVIATLHDVLRDARQVEATRTVSGMAGASRRK